MTDMISIIMPAFAVEKHLEHFEKAIAGIIAQTYTNWELLIIADGGYKTTLNQILKTVAKYKDKNIKVFRTEKQYGSGIVRNLAFKQISGKYVTFHDSDDYSVPERFEKLMANMDVNGIVTSNIMVHTLYGDNVDKRIKKYPGIALDALINDRKVKIPFCLPASIMTAELFKSMGGFEKFKYSNEPILAIKISYLREMLGIQKIPIVEEPLMIYNRHPHSVTTKFENAYAVKKCQSAQRKPLIKVFREDYLKGKIKKTSSKKEIKSALFIVNNFVEGNLIRVN